MDCNECCGLQLIDTLLEIILVHVIIAFNSIEPTPDLLSSEKREMKEMLVGTGVADSECAWLQIWEKRQHRESLFSSAGWILTPMGKTRQEEAGHIANEHVAGSKFGSGVVNR